VRISREITPQGTPTYITQAPFAPLKVAARPTSPEAHIEKSAPQHDASDKHTVKAPMVGTVYLAPSPGAKKVCRSGSNSKSRRYALLN